MMDWMFAPVLTGIAIKIAVAAFAILAVPPLLSRNNTRIGVSFREDVTEIRKSPTAAAIFHGLVFVGVCLLLGLLFG